ncbi:hypothetical protein [Sphingobacterium pedocola]|uniref:FAS1 domain-containing protein n=1 Tax=Sphingobacterium pedocola TaxID=2082722 RepID=A0ABR9TAK9_9SPHI|nr:hypothetical protein [Sphingobacterium pedocola]MBE8722400.1 hypothetical protein [Sphingobacterium pedocola]
MKKNIRNTTFAILALFFLLHISCKKDAYLTDGGLHNASTPYNAYDYLAAHKYHYFDTLLTIIDHYNLKEAVNNAGTFFVPTDRSINLYMDEQQRRLREDDEDAVYTLEKLFDELPADSVKQYLFTNKLALNDVNTSETTYTSLGSTNIKIQKVLQTDPQYYRWSTTPVYFLYYIRDLGLTTPTRVQCQTTGITTQNGNGTILHVLQNTHVFASFTN